MSIRLGATGLLTAMLVIGSVLGFGSAGQVIAQDATPAPLTAIGITISAQEFAFTGPTDVPAGLVTITFTNAGEFRHHASLFKVNEGVTAEQFIAGLATGEAFGMGVAAGGPGTIGGGGTATVIHRLGAGTYVAVCFVTGDDGIPHHQKGMAFPFTVSGEDPGEPDPAAAGEVVIGEYSITLPAATFSAGPQVWKVTNTGQENHLVSILKLPEGMTVDDYTAGIMAAATATPTPAPTTVPGATPAGRAPQPAGVGGMQALGTNQSGWVVLDLEPGTYVAVCTIRDAAGVPHTILGMIAGFSVQ